MATQLPFYLFTKCEKNYHFIGIKKQTYLVDIYIVTSDTYYIVERKIQSIFSFYTKKN